MIKVIEVIQKIKSRITKKEISKILIIFGIWMRGSGLAAAPLWYDEAFSIQMARLSFIQLIQATWLDFSPALQYLIIKPWIYFNNPWMARIPSLLASILGLAVIWEMMDDWEVTDNQRLWISALTLLPGFYWMAQDARVYAMIGLLYMISFWLLMGGQYKWAAVIMGMMIWGHLVGFILVVSLVVVNLIRDWMLQGMLDIRIIFKSTARKTIGSGLAAIGIGIPAMLPILMSPVVTEYKLNPINLAQILDSIHAAIFVEILPAGWINITAGILILIYIALAGLITLTALYHWGIILKDKESKYIIEDDIVITNGLLVVVPIILMIIISATVKPILFYRPLQILLLPFILWIGSATAMQEYKPQKLILPIALAAAIILAQISWSPRAKGSNLDHYADLINQDPGPVMYATGSVALPFDLYVDQPGWIAAYQEDNSLGSDELLALFGYKQRDPGAWADWIIWPQNELLSPELVEDLEILTAEMDLVGVVEYWQIGDTEIWHREAGQ